MSKSLRVLVIINPGASRAEAALPAVSSWFSENSDATIVVAKSKKDRKRELEVRGRKAELIVIGGGDGTISKALPQLLKLGKPFAVLPLGTANDFAHTIELRMDPIQAAEVALRSEAQNRCGPGKRPSLSQCCKRGNCVQGRCAPIKRPEAEVARFGLYDSSPALSARPQAFLCTARPRFLADLVGVGLSGERWQWSVSRRWP